MDMDVHGLSAPSEFQALRSRHLERAVMPWSRCLMIITLLSSKVIDPFGFYVLWMCSFPCSDLMLFINTCISRSAVLMRASLPQELVSHLHFSSCCEFHPNASSLASPVLLWMIGRVVWNHLFPTNGGWVRLRLLLRLTFFFFFFFAASGTLLSQISALKHTGSVQWAGKRAEQTVSVAIVSKTSLQTISVMKIKQRAEAHFHFLCSDNGRCLSWCGQYAFWWEPCDILLLCFTGKEKLFAALQNALWHLAWKQMQSVRDSSWRSSPKYQIRSVGSRGRKQHCVTISHNLSHEERSCPRQVVD